MARYPRATKIREQAIRGIRRFAGTPAITRALRSAVSPILRLNPWVLAGVVPPYEHVQFHVEENLHRFLLVEPAAVELIVIAGGHYAFEVDRMLQCYPQAQFVIFEASARYAGTLKSRFADEPRVKCEHMAVTDHCGSLSFHEMTSEGTGSILVPDVTKGLNRAEDSVVECTTLDEYFVSRRGSLPRVDLLWCDVQGAELKVLQGATELLKRCQALFLEISIGQVVYCGGASFDELDSHLRSAGFVTTLVGSCFQTNFGNGFWIRSDLLRNVDSA